MKDTVSKEKVIKEEEKLLPDITVAVLDQFSETIDTFTNEILEGCLQLLDVVPSTVHTVCDLLIGVCQRNGTTWKEDTLCAIVDQIQEYASRICDMLIASSSENVDQAQKKTSAKDSLKLICESKQAKQLAARLHLYLLMFQVISHSSMSLITLINSMNSFYLRICELFIRQYVFAFLRCVSSTMKIGKWNSQ